MKDKGGDMVGYIDGGPTLSFRGLCLWLTPSV